MAQSPNTEATTVKLRCCRGGKRRTVSEMTVAENEEQGGKKRTLLDSVGRDSLMCTSDWRANPFALLDDQQAALPLTLMTPADLQ